MKSLPVTTRSCGPCSECCTALANEEMAKGNFARCQHDRGPVPEGCCAVYAERPPTCQGFACLWLLGFVQGDERRRPDYLGLIFTWTDIIELKESVLTAWETRPGAATDESARYLLDKLARRYRLLLVVSPDRTARLWSGEEVAFTFREDGWKAEKSYLAKLPDRAGATATTGKTDLNYT